MLQFHRRYTNLLKAARFVGLMQAATLPELWRMLGSIACCCMCGTRARSRYHLELLLEPGNEDFLPIK